MRNIDGSVRVFPMASAKADFPFPGAIQENGLPEIMAGPDASSSVR